MAQRHTLHIGPTTSILVKFKTTMHRPRRRCEKYRFFSLAHWRHHLIPGNIHIAIFLISLGRPQNSWCSRSAHRVLIFILHSIFFFRSLHFLPSLSIYSLDWSAAKNMYCKYEKENFHHYASGGYFLLAVLILFLLFLLILHLLLILRGGRLQSRYFDFRSFSFSPSPSPSSSSSPLPPQMRLWVHLP